MFAQIIKSSVLATAEFADGTVLTSSHETKTAADRWLKQFETDDNCVYLECNEKFYTA